MSEQIMNEDIITNKVILRSVYKTCKYRIQPCKDPKTGRYPSCVRPVNKDGDIILTEAERIEENNKTKHYVAENLTFTVLDGTTFDLNDVVDAAEWESIKNSSFISPERWAKDNLGNYLIDGDTRANTKDARYGKAELYIDKPGLTASKKVTKRTKQHKAVGYILDEERGYDGWVLKAKLLGRNMKGQASADVQNYLMDIADTDPDRIIELYEDDKLSYRLLFMDAKDKHIIIFKDRTYQFQDTIMAATDNAVITWMQQDKNRALVELIKKETYPELFVSPMTQKTSKSLTKADK